jgi:hypothetical protein
MIDAATLPWLRRKGNSLLDVCNKITKTAEKMAVLTP